MDTLISFSAFGVLTSLWLAFGAALVLNRALLDRAWQSFRNLPLLVQLVVVLLFLPVVVGLWVWETRWPIWLRLVVMLGLAWMTIYTFFPHLQA
jgi:ABC-type amino acid transport system permease subunit